jgi:protein-disulfide isomerase
VFGVETLGPQEDPEMDEEKKEGAPRRKKPRPERRRDPVATPDVPPKAVAARPAAAKSGAPTGDWWSRIYPASVPVALVALLIGAAGGWFARDAKKTSEATVQPDPAAPAASGSAAAEMAGPCGDWVKELCLRTGDSSEGCAQARAAAELLPTSACVAAKADVAATVAKLESARSSCTTLVDKLCNDIGKETKTCAMVREKTGSFPAARCKEMLGQYDGVLGELKQMEKAEAPLSPELATRQAQGDAPGFGPANAKVTVVEYSDFECPFCGRAAEVVEKLKAKYGTQVRFVFRQYPLPMHANATLAAEASLAAHAQGKFWPFHDLLFQNQRSLDRKSLEEFATKAGLDMGKFKKALDDHTHAAMVKSDMKLGEEAGVSGTPTLFVGTERVSNPTDFEAVSKQIDAKLAN